jgi:hypothetical protein
MVEGFACLCLPDGYGTFENFIFRKFQHTYYVCVEDQVLDLKFFDFET